MAGRGIGRALLGSGLLAVTVLGGAGGYGIGLMTSAASENAGGAVPLGWVTPATDPSSTPSVPVAPRKTPKPDHTEPMQADELSYRTREFDTEKNVRSHITVKVPRNWWMTQPDPKLLGRFTDPTGKRWLRVESGFTRTRPPADSMALRMEQLRDLPPSQTLTFLSHDVDPVTKAATLAYTYIPPIPPDSETLRYVIVRWVVLDSSGFVGVEMSSTGLPQDKAALLDVLDHATKSVTRSDSPL
ncbi:hypothetical protein [Kribbella sp. NPDC006257]|uniref:hypothetical protein n=1 Tax=Kribbella sp. NPDC006257 TaxID=3156738 RepID=UPI0033AB9C88